MTRSATTACSATASETCDTEVENCEAGTAPVVTDDGIACTADVLRRDERRCGRERTRSTTRSCDDGLFCNGAETCDAAEGCLAGEAPTTDDGIDCTVDSCDEEADAIVNAADDSLCDDGAFCNGTEACNAEIGCEAGEAPATDDGIDCTVDSCDEEADAIVNTADDSLCDDGAFCNGAETCDAAEGCLAGEAPATDDGIDCTVDSCDEEADAIVNSADDSLCDDDAFCNGAETCNAESGCEAGELICDDGIDCTVDACDEDADACTATADDTFCDDGAICNGVETCAVDAGCLAGAAPDCTELDSACTIGACSEEAGGCELLPANEGQICGVPADACTIESVCLEGECVDVPLCDPECEMCDIAEGGASCRALCANPFAYEEEDITVLDALVSLRAAVGLQECSMCKCDVNGDHTITSSDTLRVMHYVIGCEADMECPMPGDTTTTTVIEPTSTTLDMFSTTTLLLD